MRTTCIRCATHLGNQFKSHWLMKRKVKVPDTGAKNILASMGLKIVDVKDLLRPPINEEPYDPPVEILKELKPECFMINNRTHPIETIYQAQLLTNTITFDHLSKSVTNCSEEPGEEDIEFLSNVLLKAHLLDAQQDLLPLNLDPINEPGFRPPRSYGIKTPRMIKSILYPLVIQYNRLSNTNKIVLQNEKIGVSLKHSGNLMNIQHQTNMILLSRIPLSPIIKGEELISAINNTVMPDISPLSPFANIIISEDYNMIDRYCSLGGIFAPHTVFVDYVNLREPRSEKHFTSCSLLHCFSNAAAYAKELGHEGGDLKIPVTLNLVHTNGCYIQCCQFQLNSLDLTGPRKNFFWYNSWDKLFTNIKFIDSKPVIENVNAKPIMLMKALLSS